MPGTAARCLGILAESSGRAPGDAFTLAVNPEFLREGVGMADFASAPFTIIGVREPAWAEPLTDLYSFLSAPVAVTSPEVAELLKTVCNAWHATKVAFANETARLCGELGTDPHELMRLFVRDERLNLSASYLTPGFAYGGSCLPKDVEALAHLARRLHVELPVMQAVPRSNELHIERAFAAIERSGCDRIGFLGLSFKAGTDDLRGSPLLTLVQRCLGRGFRVRIYDPNVQVASLVGSNREYALSRVRRLDDLLVTDVGTLGSELVVLGHDTEEMRAAARGLPATSQVLDLVRAVEPEELAARYVGLAW
jgi:GDP-mannose 6-dehydrogenase